MKEKILALFNDLYKEWKKITFPTQQELKESTMIVIVMCIILAAFTWVIDLGISQLFKVMF